MVVKVYLEEAYNQVDWVFLENIVVGIGFSPSLTNLIMHFVRSTTLSALWNGEKLDEFSRSHGLRQGDPLSHIYLLSKDTVSRKQWQPIQLSRCGPKLSHLFFAHDLILFGGASTAQAKIMKKVLEKFVQSRDNM